MRVAYLIGAGATHACAQAANSPYGVLMSDLRTELSETVREIAAGYADAPAVQSLANDVITDTCDYEHVITFLDEAVSEPHRRFAADVKKAFEKVLKKRLALIEEEHGAKPTELYAALLDIHELAAAGEDLAGILSLNYDDYLETAATNAHNRTVDFGIRLHDVLDHPPVRLLKLHGSFSWAETWPITSGGGGVPLWIPPGIQKAKNRYPFNLIWGKAREVLDCDVLRIIGCRLSANDWDLVSLLFSTRLTRFSGKPYTIEVIDAPSRAEQLQTDYPYLSVQSLFEIDGIGQGLIGESLGGAPKALDMLTDSERETLRQVAKTERNWLSVWLKLKVQDLFDRHGSVKTESGRLEDLLEQS
jgi:hypothetical protein